MGLASVLPRQTWLRGPSDGISQSDSQGRWGQLSPCTVSVVCVSVSLCVCLCVLCVCVFVCFGVGSPPLRLRFPTPAKIFKLETSSDFRISRTYCVSAVANKYSALEVSIFNHIYSTRPTSVRVHVSSVEELPGPTSWRRGYYGRGAEQWQTDPQPLPPGESSHLSKRMDAQCDHLPHHRDRLHGRYDFLRKHWPLFAGNNGDENNESE